MNLRKEDYIKYRISKSKEIYRDAILLVENGRWNSSINRLYYSCYYVISALLYKNNLKAETHNGVKTQFFLHFVKKGLISKDLGKLYSHLFDWRQESDYADFVEFDENTVKSVIPKVVKLHEDLIAILAIE